MNNWDKQLSSPIWGAEQENNMKWNSGLACTGNTGNADFDQKIKDFSMYNLDQRVLNNMGIIDRILGRYPEDIKELKG